MDPLMIGGGVVVLIILFVLGSMLATCFQKCGPNQAMIVSGLLTQGHNREFKIVKGGGTCVLPLIQKKDFLSLEVMTIEVKSQSAIITTNGVPIFVEGVAQIKVKGDDESIATAAEQFLNKSDDEIKAIAHETLVGHLRAILGTLNVEELVTNFDNFAQKVQEVSAVDLRKMGLTVVSFTIKDINDKVGYLEAMGRKKTAETKRDADIGVAHATRETAIAQSEAQRDSQIAQSRAAEEGAKAKLVADTHVAEAQKEFQVNQATYQGEISQKKAVSDLSYEIVKAQTTQKLIEEQQKIKIVETQKAVELQTVEVQKRQVELEAEVTKPAEAEQTKVRIYAQAELEKRKLLAQADADSAQMRAKGDAEATRLKAIAEAEAIRVTGIANAEAQRVKGLAEAQVIAAKGEAEAQAMLKKAEAFKQYNDAALASMLIDKLPDVVNAASTPLSKIGNMTVLSTGGDGIGASRITGEVLNVAAQSLTMVKGLTGIDLAGILKKDSKDSNTAGNGQPEPAKIIESTTPKQG